MEKKKIKRPFLSVDTSNQLNLFASIRKGGEGKKRRWDANQSERA